MLSRRISSSSPCSSVIVARVLWALLRFGVVELDVVGLAATDHRLLLLGGHRVPGCEVVEVLLHDHVAAAREGGILIADERRLGHARATRVRRCRRRSRAGRARRSSGTPAPRRPPTTASPSCSSSSRSTLEAEVRPVGTDVEEQVARRRRRRMRAGGDRDERSQLGRSAAMAEPFPRGRSDADDAREVRPHVAEADRLCEVVESRRRHRGGGEVGGIRADRRHEEHRELRERGIDPLRIDRHPAVGLLHAGSLHVGGVRRVRRPPRRIRRTCRHPSGRVDARGGPRPAGAAERPG